MKVPVTIPEYYTEVEIPAKEIVFDLGELSQERCEIIVNECAGVLKEITSKSIANLKKSQRQVIADFLHEQARRYEDSGADQIDKVISELDRLIKP